MAYVLFPTGSRLSVVERLTLIGGLGTGIAAVISLVLVALGQLTPLALALVLSAVSLLGVVLAVVRGSVRRPRLRRPRLAYAGAAVGVAFLVLIAGPQLLLHAYDPLPSGTTIWYYWSNARDLAEAGAVPATVPEWGAPRPFQTDYLAFAAHVAAFDLLTPLSSELREMDVHRISTLTLAYLTVWSLMRRMLRFDTAAGAVFLIASSSFWLIRFGSLRPETFALTLGLIGCWAFLRALEPAPARRRWALLAILLLALTFSAHAEVYVALVILCGGLALGHFVAGLPWRPADLMRAGRSALTWAPAGFLALVVAASAVLGLATTIAIEGEAAHLRSIESTQAIPEGTDPTWDFYRLAYQLPADRAAPTSLLDPLMLHGNARVPWPFLRLDRVSIGLVGVLLVASLLAWPWTPRRTRRALVATVSAGIVLTAAVLYFFLAYDTYVPQRVGPRRLAPYDFLFLAIFFMVAVETLGHASRVLLRWLGARLAAARRDRLPAESLGTTARTVAASASIAAVVALSLFAARDVDTRIFRSFEEPTLTERGYGALHWIGDHTPDDAIILTNAWTDGSFGALARRNGLLNGRAPYLEDLEWLDLSISLLERSQAYFADPTDPSFPREHRVTHLLVAVDPHDLGVNRLLPASRPIINQRPELRRVMGWGTLALYEVLPEATARAAPGEPR